MCFLGHIYKMPEDKHARDTLSLFQLMAEDDQASRGQKLLEMQDMFCIKISLDC